MPKDKLPTNFGLLESDVQFAKDWRMGGISGTEKHVIRADGDYSDFLPEIEYQAGVYFDTMACVSFSALNCLETIAKSRGIMWNKSDRFTAKMSGTGKRGNFLRNVAESLRTHGVVDEEEWEFPQAQRQPVFDWDDYYSEIPDTVRMDGLKLIQNWDIKWEWVRMDQVRDALKYGPIQVTVKAWPKPLSNGMYDDGGSIYRNHAVMLYKMTDEYCLIFDHYSKTYKKLVPDYDFRSAMQFSLTRKTTDGMPALTLPNDVLVQEVEKSGTFGLHLDGKIIVDDTDKLIASFMMRNKGYLQGKTLALSLVDWNSFPKVNLRNMPI